MNCRSLVVLLLGLWALSSVGCVAQGQYDQMQKAYWSEKERVTDLEAKLEEAQSRITALQEQMRTMTNNPDMSSAMAQAIADRDAMRKALADAEDRLRRLGADSGPLNPETNQALTELAAQYPDLMTYDPKRGMLRFSADLTFPLGSTEVSKAGQDALSKLATILKAPAAEGYEAEVEGHTDNVPISRVRAQHPTNWHLSVHRAIAVKDVLEHSGVPASRLKVSGYGEYRPIVPNGAKGAQQNRRVEIYIQKSTFSGNAGGEAPAAPVGPAPKAPAKVDDSQFK